MKSFKTHIREAKMQRHISDFVSFACEELGIDEPPAIILIDDKKQAQNARSFGGYRPAEQDIRVNIAERHLADVLRTLAHELTHHKQNLDNRLDEYSGETGSDIENEANAQAGIIMRNYARAGNNIFESIEEES